MSTLLNMGKGVYTVVNVSGIPLVIDHEIEYVTVDKNGEVHGWSEARPYYDEDDQTWSTFELYGDKWHLATITDPQDCGELIEVYP
ncbi:hypothetical protein VPHK567_0071 [Vibrio phage K567]